MSLFENLLRASRRDCEERRRYLAELELLVQRLRDDAARLRGQTERSGIIAGLHDELIDRRNQLDRSIADVEARISGATEALGAAEQELRRHELGNAQRGAAVRPGRRRPTRGSPANGGSGADS